MWPFKAKEVKTTNDSEQETKLEGVELHVVSWESRYDQWSGSTKTEFEAFPDIEEAIRFKKDLESAFKLIRHTSGNKVKLETRG